MSPRLGDAIALITGADSGIGQATALEFAKEGAAVAVHYLHDQKGANATRDQILGAGGRAAVIQADLSKREEIERLFDRCRTELGTATILVNNAGIDAGGKPVADMDPEHWDQVIRVNLTAPFLCCRRFIRDLKLAKGHGKIINISSVHQEIPRAGAAEYDASKGGLRNLTTTLALELAPAGVTVNNIAPGMVLTPMNQEAIDDPKKLEEQVQSIPLKRAAEPWEIAKLALYLASEDANYVTGATFVIDGGLTLNLGQGA